MDWTKPGRSGAVIYALAAVALGAVVAAFSRLSIARDRGRRAAVSGLPDGPVIVISNHASYVDGIMLALVCRRMGRSIRLLATSGVFRAPGLGWLARKVGFIPVDRGTGNAAEALGLAAAALEAGEAVGIFPEGRTTRDPDHWPERAKTGAVRLALMTDVPIVPIAMVGTHRVLTRGHPIRSLVANLLLRPQVLVEVGQPIDVVGLAEPTTTDQPDIRELSDQVMSHLVALVADLRQEDPPGRAASEPAGGGPEPRRTARFGLRRRR